LHRSLSLTWGVMAVISDIVPRKHKKSAFIQTARPLFGRGLSGADAADGAAPRLRSEFDDPTEFVFQTAALDAGDRVVQPLGDRAHFAAVDDVVDALVLHHADGGNDRRGARAERLVQSAL